MLERIIGESISIELQLGSAIPGIFADVGMLEQVLINLAVNARDAMPEGGKLTLRTSVRNEASLPTLDASSHVCLSVGDTGSGIAPELLGRIFEPYFSTKDMARGTGLGLATVQSIVSAHGGFLRVESELGSGSVFLVYLPAGSASVEPVKVATALSRPKAAARGGETLLVVEDDEAVRKVLTASLRRQGYELLMACHAAEALEIWKRRQAEVALLITDVIMPGGMGGLELIEVLRGERPALPFLCVSGYAPDYDGASFSLVEGENFIRKPFSLVELAEVVRRRLDQAQEPLRA
jgi:CheY-like chemotaxis protein